MSKIVWGLGSQYYHTGVSHGVLYIQNPDGTYATGVPWNGLISVSESSTGAEKTTIYADNMVYAGFRSDEGLTGTIEAFSYPSEFSNCNGSPEVVLGVHLEQQRRKRFGFSYQTMVGPDDYILHILYGLGVSSGERQYAALSESPEALTHSWDFESVPVILEGFKPTVSVQIDSRKVNEAKMKVLEDMLYGTPSSDPTLPSLAEVIEISIGLDFRNLLCDAIATLGLWRWDPFNFKIDTIQIAIEREANLRVYFSPASGTELLYPCVTYITLPNTDYENEDSVNFHRKHYEVTVITLTETSSVITAVAAIPTAELTSSRLEDGKYYNVYSIYY